MRRAPLGAETTRKTLSLMISFRNAKVQGTSWDDKFFLSVGRPGSIGPWTETLGQFRSQESRRLGYFNRPVLTKLETKNLSVLRLRRWEISTRSDRTEECKRTPAAADHEGGGGGVGGGSRIRDSFDYSTMLIVRWDKYIMIRKHYLEVGNRDGYRAERDIGTLYRLKIVNGFSWVLRTQPGTTADKTVLLFSSESRDEYFGLSSLVHSRISKTPSLTTTAPESSSQTIPAMTLLRSISKFESLGFTRTVHREL
ncbi:hypothetical protein C8R42DRAFT_706884 [Lentinula raphanica]|nr:hypothetical protein C8R42DRAFT_706884 [Lentinula raphanica]